MRVYRLGEQQFAVERVRPHALLGIQYRNRDASSSSGLGDHQWQWSLNLEECVLFAGSNN